MSRSLCCLMVLLLAGCGEPVEAPGDDSRSARSEGATRLGVLLGSPGTGTAGDDASSSDPVSADGFDRAERPRVFRFPEDHGRHPRFRSEWWYLTAALADSSGREFGVQFTLFRQALRAPRMVDADLPWPLDHAFLAHVALVDVEHGEHRAWERLSRDHPLLAGVSPEPGADPHAIRAYLDDWNLRITEDGLHLQAGAEGWQADLALRARRRVVPQGERGLSRKSAGQASYYYSWPRLAAEGTVRSPDGLFTVRGLGWFDHEWSTSVLSPEQTGWDWLAVHLDDGRSLMAFRLRRSDGQRDPFDHGALIDADGGHRVLAAEDFQLLPETYWTDPDGVRWPVGWVLRTGSESFDILAALPDQRMQLRIPYWEGLVHVDDASGQRVGAGYLELTGY